MVPLELGMLKTIVNPAMSLWRGWVGFGYMAVGRGRPHKIYSNIRYPLELLLKARAIIKHLIPVRFYL